MREYRVVAQLENGAALMVYCGERDDMRKAMVIGLDGREFSFLGYLVNLGASGDENADSAGI